jgi:hypothetical protein
MDFVVAWPLGLAFGCASSVAAFLLARRTTASPSRRRLLFALAALLAFATSFPVGLTAMFFLAFGATGYCEDYGGPCAPRSWVPLGVACAAVVVGLVYLIERSIKAYRQAGAPSG